MTGRFGGFQRRLLAMLLALGGVTLLSVCADVNGPGNERRGHVAFAPTLGSASAAALGASSTVIDNVHIVIRNLDGAIVFDAIIPFPADADEVSIAVDLPVHGESERFRATIQLRSGDVVLFEGTQDLDVAPGQQTGPPASVPLTYVGTGSNATSVGVAPGSADLLTNGSASFVATVRDAAGTIIQNVPLGWTSSDENVASVSDDGVVTAHAVRGTATITATTFGGVTGSASARVTLPPSQLRVGGGGQTGRVGDALAVPFTVELLAADGVGVANAAVSFSTNNPGATISPATATTDANGRASATITLGTTAGPQSFSASAGSFSANITATALAGEANRIAIFGGNGQSGLTGTALATPLAVKVTDEFGNAGAGRQVNWSAVTSGTVGAAATTTDATGVATNTFTLPVAAGPASIQASLSIGGSVVFGATALQRPPSSVAATSGTPQSGTVGTATQPLVLRVLDALNQPVANVSVAWSVTGTATIGAATSTTNASGFASIVANFGPTPGGSTITAAVAGAGNAVFALTAIAGGPATIEVFAGDGQTAAAGNAVPIAPAVRVLDALGNVLAGIPVTFGGATGGGSVTLPNQVTDANGIATVGSWILGGFAPTQAMTATVGVLTATFNATATATPILHLVSISGNAQSGPAGSPLALPMVVEVRDTSNIPVAGVSVQFTVTLGGGTPATQVIVSDVNGRAAFTLTPGSVGAQSVTACLVPGCTSVVSFSATGTAAGNTRTWTGVTSNAWTLASNWSPALVPTALNDVVVPSGTPNLPFLFGAVTVNNLTVSPAATLNLNGFTLTSTGDINTTSASVVGGTVVMTGITKTVRGALPSLTIDAGAAVTVTGVTIVSGNVVVQNASTLDMGVNTMTVGGTFDVTGAGSHLKMNNAGGSLIVTGTATFNGADMAGVDLTAGLLDLKGNIVANNTNGSQAFHAAGTHLTRFSGTGPQSITFAVSGPGFSTFFNVAITNLSGAGVTLSASNANVNGAMNQDGRLTVAATRALTITGALTLGTASTTTVAPGGTITAGSCTPLGAASFSGFACGAGPVTTWLGGTSSDFNTGSNWSTGLVPLSTQNVLVPAGTTFSIVLTGTVGMNDFTLAPGATFNTAGNQVQIGRNVVIGGTIVGGGQMLMTPIAGTMVGNFPLNIEISAGPVVLNGGTTVTGNVVIQGGGVLDIGTSTMTIDGNLDLVGAANLKMNDGDAVLTVTGNAGFAGGDMGNTDLTAGTLIIEGNFFASPATQGFRGVGTHTTRFAGEGPQSINFFSPGNAASRFQNLEFMGGNTVTFVGNVYAAGSTFIDNNTTLTSAGNCCILFVSGLVTATPGTNLAGLNRIEVFGGSGAILPEIGGIGPPAIHLNSGTTITSGTTPLIIPSTLRIFSSGTILDVAAHTITVNGNFSYQAGGAFSMTNATGHLIVNGDLTADDINMGDALLTDGLLEVTGNVSTGPNGTQVFRAMGAHVTRFIGTGAQSISMASPGVSGAKFQGVEITNASASGVTTASGVFVGGDLVQNGRLTTSAFTLNIAGNILLGPGSNTTALGPITFAGCNDNGATSYSGFTCSGLVPPPGAIKTGRGGRLDRDFVPGLRVPHNPEPRIVR